jgi:hypothetical protein
MAQLLVQILKKFGSGAKHSDFGVEVESLEPEKNPKYIKPSAFSRSVVDRRRFDTDPNPNPYPTFHFDADTDPNPDPTISYTHVENHDFCLLFAAVHFTLFFTFLVSIIGVDN